MQSVAPVELVDEGTKGDGRGRRRYAREHVEKLLLESASSGLTQPAFARRAGVRYQTFAGRVRSRRIRATGLGEPLVFAEVQVAKSALADASLSVQLPDGMVVRGREIESIAALVRALGRR